MRVARCLPAMLSSSGSGRVQLTVTLDAVERGKPRNAQSFAGFLIGSGSPGIDYRITALTHHRPAQDGGIVVAVDGTGRIVFRDFEKNVVKGSWGIAGKLAKGELAELPASRRDDLGLALLGANGLQSAVLLRVTIHREAGAKDLIVASAHQDGALLSQASLAVDRRLTDGMIGLCSHRGPVGSKFGHSFGAFQLEQLTPEARDPSAALLTLDRHGARRFGPFAGCLYTIHEGILKLTAQMLPLGQGDAKTATLWIADEETSGKRPAFRQVASANFDPDAQTFRFRVEEYEADRVRPFEVRWTLRGRKVQPEQQRYAGTLRAEPTGDVKLAAFTGCKHFTGGLRWNHKGIWFPHADLVAKVKKHDPDLLFFSGDQVYEGDITGAQRRPADKGRFDYLDKWYRWYWTFAELTRTRPTVCITDDHDVYHGNIWGARGRKAKRQDDGGYTMPARFVKMVERTQTSHLPDPFSPTPVLQGIGTYFTGLKWGGVSFAILEDRKFKSSPSVMCKGGKCINGWFRNPDYNPATQADVPGAELLGGIQLSFLRYWSSDWSSGVWWKCALSQTIFANVATLPRSATSDGVVPGLRVFPKGAYAPDDLPVADADSNGWPQSGRQRALRELRKGFALHVAGDQHLGSLIRYGVDEWDDAGFAFCVPSVANTWPRRWFPPRPGANRWPGAPNYCGSFVDGFGNRMTVHAVSNPHKSGVEPTALHDRAPGYGIVRFRKKTRDAVIECWPRHVDPTAKDAQQYPGWPKTVTLEEQYARQARAWTPELDIKGVSEPVVTVLDEHGELVSARRFVKRRFRVPVYAEGYYILVVGEPGTPKVKQVRVDAYATPPEDEEVLLVDLEAKKKPDSDAGDPTKRKKG